MHNDRVLRKQTLDTIPSSWSVTHPTENQPAVFRCKQPIIDQLPQQLNGRLGLKPVSILRCDVTMQVGLIVFDMKPSDAQRPDVIVEGARTTGHSQNDIGSHVVAARN